MTFCTHEQGACYPGVLDLSCVNLPSSSILPLTGEECLSSEHVSDFSAESLGRWPGSCMDQLGALEAFAGFVASDPNRSDPDWKHRSHRLESPYFS